MLGLGQSLFGMRIIVDPLMDNFPKFQLSPSFAAMMPAAWVAEQNQWCREFFGTESKALALPDGSMVIGLKAAAELKRKSYEHHR